MIELFKKNCQEDKFSARFVPKKMGWPPTKKQLRVWHCRNGKTLPYKRNKRIFAGCYSTDETMIAILTPLLMRICSRLNFVKKNHKLHHGDCTNTFTKSAGTYQENMDKFFKTKTVTRGISRTRISQEERSFIVGTGASVLMMSKGDLIHEGKEPFRKSKESCTIITSNGSITTTQEASVYVRDLEMLITSEILEDSPAVLSQKKNAKNMGIPTNGKKTIPHINQGLKQTHCKSEHCAPTVVPGVSVDTRAQSDADAASGDREQDIPDWLQHSRKDWYEENLDHPAVLVKRFPKYVLHIFQQNPWTNLEGNTRLQQLSSKESPNGILLELPWMRVAAGEENVRVNSNMKHAKTQRPIKHAMYIASRRFDGFSF